MNGPEPSPSWLIVPIDVAALCIGGPDAAHQGVGALGDFSKLPPQQPGPYLSKQALWPEPFAGQADFEVGVHIHWALPDGLTTGSQQEGGNVNFPTVPNRWLVTRIVVQNAASAAPSLTSWVIESDRMSSVPAKAGTPQPTVPIEPIGTPSFQYLGYAAPLAGWAEQQGVPRLEPLTAVGYGEPTFAALYPNCANVFGFLDTLAGVPLEALERSRVAYHVAGWYKEGDDPLENGLPPENEQRWSYHGDSRPTRTLCSGVVHDIPWDPRHAYLATPPAPTVAIGSSTVEAVSALLASEMPATAKAETLLNALQLGALGRGSQIDSHERFEEAVHAAGFTSSPGGVLWAVNERDPTPGQQGATEPEGEELTLPDELAEQLDALNALQLEHDRAGEQLAGLQRALYLDWWRYQDLAEAPSSAAVQKAAAAAYLKQRVTVVQAAKTRVEDLNTRVKTASAAVSLPAGGSLTLNARPLAPRYYAPSDPVLLLSGEAAQPARRYGGDGDGDPNGYLPCRREGELVGEIAIAATATSAAVTVASANLPTLATMPLTAPYPLLAAALHDAIFLTPSLQPIVAQAAAAKHGVNNPAIQDFTATVKLLSEEAAGFVHGGQTSARVGHVGAPPNALMLRAWTGTPWLPVLLQWRVRYEPAVAVGPTAGGAAYPSNLLTGRFALDADRIDLEPTTAFAAAPAQEYSGSALLNPDVTVELEQEIEQFAQATGGSTSVLGEALTKLRAAPLLAQGLSGFGDALLMQSPALQLCVADPAASQAEREQLVLPVARAVGAEGTHAPLTAAQFNPLRTGNLTVTALRLIDAFGRTLDCGAITPIVAAALQPPSGAQPGRAFLRPRITQPARLLFRWRAAVDDSIEMNSHPATSPVLGWIVPNYLDDSIVVYDADGAPLAELGLGVERTSVLFTPAPGGSFHRGATLSEVFANAHPRLKELAEAVGGDASFLAPFFDTMRAALALSLPASFKQDAGTALLLGQPLVLARASLQLDLAGPPAQDQSWGAFARAVANNTPPGEAGLGALRFPVALGAPAQLEDTMIGYWLQGSTGATDFATFYSPYAHGSATDPVRTPQPSTLTLSPGESGPVTVTVLLDPRGSVHATTGVLPVKSIAIPPDQFAEALERLAVTFAARPVLSGAPSGAAPALPQPKVADGRWSWTTMTGAGAWQNSALAEVPGGDARLDYSPQRLLEGWLRLELGDGAGG